jgi:hypothetical protein
MPKKKYNTVLLHCDSRDRPNYPNGSSTLFQLNLQYPVRNIVEISLESAEIANTSNCFDDTNNTLIVKEQNLAKIFSYQIPVGNYTPSLLLSTIASGLTTESSISGNSYTYTCSFSSITQKLTISTGSGQNFTFLWEANNLANQQLGFLAIDRLGYTTSYTAENTLDLAPESYIFLQLGNIGGNSAGCNFSDQNYTFKIQMSGTSSDIVSYHSSGNGLKKNIILTQPINLSYLQVDFYSYKKKRWTNNNVDVSFTLGLKVKQ